MPDFAYELMHGRLEGKIVCGVDEVGRGPLAGPVIAAAAILPDNALTADVLGQINDSKKLSLKKREQLFPVLVAACPHAIAQASVEEIDSMNILNASLLAMSRAVRQLELAPDFALIDGNKMPKDLPCPSCAIVKGDSKSLSIAVASIIAKVTRDRMMGDLHKAYPHYDWDRNAGYGTAAHIAAITAHGITPWHRRSFAPVSSFCSSRHIAP